MRPAFPGSVIATAALVAAANAQSPRTSEWPSYGNDAGGTRFSAASQITPANVKGLRLAWLARTGDLLADRGRFEATPLLVRGTLYVSTPLGSVVALDPVTGAERWRFAGPVELSGDYGDFANRGVARMDRGGRPRRRTVRDPNLRGDDQRPTHRARWSNRHAVRGLRRQRRPGSHDRAATQARVSLGVRRHLAADDRRESGDRRLGGAGRPSCRRPRGRDPRVRRSHRRAAMVVRSHPARREGPGVRDVDRTQGPRHRRRQRVEYFLRGLGARPRVHSRRQREPRLLRRRAAGRQQIRELRRRAACVDRRVRVGVSGRAPRPVGLRRPGAAGACSRCVAPGARFRRWRSARRWVTSSCSTVATASHSFRSRNVRFPRATCRERRRRRRSRFPRRRFASCRRVSR